jgi:hypothetical protein
MDLLERIELALVAEQLRNGRGVLWYPQRTLDHAALPALLAKAGAPPGLEHLNVLDVSDVVNNAHSYVKKLEGEDLANDLRWDSLNFLLKGSATPYASILGMDALESVYGVNVVPKLLQHVDAMRRGGHMVVVEVTDRSSNLEPLSHQARMHLRLENINGSVVLHGVKPSSVFHCLEVEDGVPRWVPMI